MKVSTALLICQPSSAHFHLSPGLPPLDTSVARVMRRLWPLHMPHPVLCRRRVWERRELWHRLAQPCHRGLWAVWVGSPIMRHTQLRQGWARHWGRRGQVLGHTHHGGHPHGGLGGEVARREGYQRGRTTAASGRPRDLLCLAGLVGRLV